MTASLQQTRNKLLFLSFVLGLLLALSAVAYADEERMPGRMDRRGPAVERSTDETAAQPANRRDRRRAAAEDDAVVPPPPKKPAVEDAAEAPATTPAPRFSGADDRMAGSVPVDAARAREGAATPDTIETTPAPARAAAPPPTKAVEARLPPVKNIPIEQLELHGLLTSPADRSLGIDLWHGSARATVNKLLPQIPAASRYRTLQDLTARMLLTETESGFLTGGRAQPGEDLMTLRLEKLIEIGAYDEAARLYALNPGRPYHERLARAGVTAMLLGERRALGCLEVKALSEAYKDVDFWQQADGICTIFMAGNLGKSKQSPVPTAIFANSPVLQKIVDNNNASFRPDDMAALADLNPLERIGVFTLSRVDYSKIARVSLADMMKAEPSILSAMLGEASLSPRLRLFASIAAVHNGAAPVSRLAAFYESEAAQSGQDDSKLGRGWKALPSLYRQAKNYSPGNARDGVLQQALALRRTFGTASLLPFAPMLAESDPGNLPPESIAASLAVMVKAGQDIPVKWRQLGLAVLSPEHRGGDDALAYFAFDISQGFRPFKDLEASELQQFFTKMDPRTAKIVKTIYEKLDKGNKLHNIDAEEAYEKDPVLTASDDYVMPLSSLLSDLELAEKDKRLGEIILISSVLLRSTPAGKITPEVLGEVLDGFKTVGLTREARELAAEVVLGLRK